MIHELRIYHCMPGRLPDLLKRFETITLAIWERFGIRQAGFWTVEMGASNQDLYYLLEWESLEILRIIYIYLQITRITVLPFLLGQEMFLSTLRMEKL